jgi:hypothetical protein
LQAIAGGFEQDFDSEAIAVLGGCPVLSLARTVLRESARYFAARWSRCDFPTHTKSVIIRRFGSLTL